MAELFLEMTQWKAWSIVTVKMTENVLRLCVRFFFFVFFFLFLFMCHVCILSLMCLFNISGEFDALHPLSVKMDPLEIQHPKLENSRRSFIESVHER